MFSIIKSTDDCFYTTNKHSIATKTNEHSIVTNTIECYNICLCLNIYIYNTYSIR